MGRKYVLRMRNAVGRRWQQWDGSSQETHVPACTHCNCRCVLSSPALRLALQRLLCFVSCIWGLRALNCLHYFLPVEGAQRISIRAAGPPTPIIRGSRGHRIYMSVRRGQASLHQPRRPLIGVDHIPPGQLSGGRGGRHRAREAGPFIPEVSTNSLHQGRVEGAAGGPMGGEGSQRGTRGEGATRDSHRLAATGLGLCMPVRANVLPKVYWSQGGTGGGDPS